MPERLDDFLLNRPPTADRPLAGQTILVVEDSRFASEAMRLLCLRSGARVRRADSLAAAARHLATYRPTVVIVDEGLPDGSGAGLIAELVAARPRIPVIIATSGDGAIRERALANGADAFFEKPLTSLAAFQELVIGLLPEVMRPALPRPLPDAEIAPDRLALKDDLAHAVAVLEKAPDADTVGYVAKFLHGLGQSAQDTLLLDAARELAGSGAPDFDPGLQAKRIMGLVGGHLSRRAVV